MTVLIMLCHRARHKTTANWAGEDRAFDGFPRLAFRTKVAIRATFRILAQAVLGAFTGALMWFFKFRMWEGVPDPTRARQLLPSMILGALFLTFGMLITKQPK